MKHILAITEDAKVFDDLFRKGKYVVHRYGNFTVNLIADDRKSIEKEVDCNLSPCKNCLKEFNYKDYSVLDYSSRLIIHDEFEIQDFFSQFNSQVPIARDVGIQPISYYSENRDVLSREYKQSKNWVCEDCGKNCLNTLMHTHYIDHNKGNNSWSNYKALCVTCHQEYHEHSIL